MDNLKAIRLLEKGPDDYVLTKNDEAVIYAAILDAFTPVWKNGKWWGPPEIGSFSTLRELRSVRSRLMRMVSQR